MIAEDAANQAPPNDDDADAADSVRLPDGSIFEELNEISAQEAEAPAAGTELEFSGIGVGCCRVQHASV